MGDLGQTNCKPTITARGNEGGASERSQKYEAKKAETKQSKNSVKATQSKQSKARTKSKQTKNKHCKKGNTPKKKERIKTKNQKTQAKGQQTERGAWQAGARCYVEQVVVEWGKVARTSSISTANFCTLKRFTQIQSLNQ